MAADNDGEDFGIDPRPYGVPPRDDRNTWYALIDRLSKDAYGTLYDDLEDHIAARKLLRTAVNAYYETHGYRYYDNAFDALVALNKQFATDPQEVYEGPRYKVRRRRNRRGSDDDDPEEEDEELVDPPVQGSSGSLGIRRSRDEDEEDDPHGRRVVARLGGSRNMSQKRTYGRRSLKGGRAKERYLATQQSYDLKHGRPVSAPSGMVYAGRNDQAASFYVPSEDKVVIGVRGTVDGKDWLEANWRIGPGSLRGSPQYQEAREMVLRMKREYPGKKIELGGHSLGGSIVAELAREFPDDVEVAEVWNPGVGINDIMPAQSAPIVRHHHVLDPLRYNPIGTVPGLLTPHSVTYSANLWGHPLSVFPEPS